MASHLMTWLRRALATLAVLAWAVALSVSPALAAGDKKVGIVVVYSTGKVQTVIVTIPEDGTTADALKASGLPVVIAETSFGPALCKIGDDGCPADNCFCDKKSWAYWHLEGNEWKYSDVGVGGYKPADKAVEGFTWTGYDANFNPLVKPPVVSFADIEAGKAPTMLPVTGAAPADDLASVRVGAAALGLLALAGYAALRRRARGLI